MKPTHGLSLDLNPNTVAKFGGAFKIKSIPKELKIIQRGQGLDHFEIVPRKPMPIEEYQELLKKIEVI